MDYSLQDIYDLVDDKSEKVVLAGDYPLLKNTDCLFLYLIEDFDNQEEFLIVKNQTVVNIPLNLSICKVTDISLESNRTIFVDEDQLVFPLVLWKWKTVDVFMPFGMGDKSKKAGKFFKGKVIINRKRKYMVIVFK